MMAYSASSATICGLISPVAATSSSQCTSCDPNLSDEPDSASPTAARYRNGGHSTFSTPFTSSVACRNPFASSLALSSRVLHFQFAAAIGTRIDMSLLETSLCWSPSARLQAGAQSIPTPRTS